MEFAKSRSEIQTTAFLLSNLHCPSCVSNIEIILSALEPAPESICPSIVTSWVTVRHDQFLSADVIRSTLEDAGYNICSVTEDGVVRDTGRQESFPSTYHPFDGYIENKGRSYRFSKTSRKSRAFSIHLKYCEKCRDEVRKSQKFAPFDPDLKPTAPHITAVDGRLPIANDHKEVAPLPSIEVVIRPNLSKEDQIWQATLAIGGMTCASCANSIIEELEKTSWVEKVVVNLITNSATVEFTGQEHTDEIAQMIEDIGFEAVLDNIHSKKAAQTISIVRTVEVLVEGMFCSNCPDRLLRSLDEFEGMVTVEKPLTLADPIMRISYTPMPPAVSIRRIMSILSAAESKCKISIYHPPTLEERSRTLHVIERRRILIRVILAVITAIPTFVIGVLFMSLVPSENAARQYFEQPWTPGISKAQWALFILASPVYFFAADVFHRRAVKEIYSMWKKGSRTPWLQRFYRFGSMNMLMSLGTSIAYISSVAQLIAATYYPNANMDNGSFYFDSVVFLTMFLLIGRLIEAYSKSRTGDAVSMLGKLRPTEAILIENNTATGEDEALYVSVDLLELGDKVRVPNGASPPCDGLIIEGESSFDESSLTGESKPVKKCQNNDVYSGTINKGGPVLIKITGVAGTSMLDQIVEAVREGQTRRAPMERIADTMTGYFVPIITLIAILTWVGWLSLGLSSSIPPEYLDNDSGSWASWSLQFAIAVFVVACPCGLALAAPTALFVGGGLAAQHGILVKGGGEAFEKASRVDCIVFDKTGTLTVGGEPVVTDFENFATGPGIQPCIFSAVKQLEEHSGHPVAKAIVSFCKTKTQDQTTVEDVEEIPGRGMSGLFKQKDGEARILIGNEALLLENGVVITEAANLSLREWKLQGKSVVVVATMEPSSLWQLSAILAVSDPIRPEALPLIRQLNKKGVDVWMLSGDNYTTASAIGAQVGIPPSHIIAGVLPNQKANEIKYLQRSLKARNSQGRELSNTRATIAMVGDGINDSPALTAADIGIAIGSGSDIAISSAEFVLVTSNLTSLITLLDLSKLVFRRIKINFAWALIYNMVAVPVAAGALYPIMSNGSHIRLDPVWASLAMALSSISVVCSSLSLRANIPWVGFRVRKIED
jgi:Cu+-exporting ATPase